MTAASRAPAAADSPWRVALSGGYFSYRALFNWIRPEIYVPMMLIVPVLQLVFFANLGRFAAGASAGYFVVANALQVSAIATLFGATMTIANERSFGTLSAIVATPASRVALFGGRMVPIVVNGLLVSVVTFVAGFLIFKLPVPADRIAALAAVVLVTVISCTGLGLLVASLALRARDVLFLPNLVYFLTLIVCGVAVPRSALPDWLAATGQVLPLTHGIQAGWGVVLENAPTAEVASLLAREALTGLVCAVLGLVALRLFEVSARRRGGLEGM